MKINAGFTLIEVLIALIILAVGLLGLAGLQATSLRNNQSAYNRSVATQLAYDIVDRMRTNYTEAKKLAGNTYISIAPDEAHQNKDCSSVVKGCTPAAMAENDLYEWNCVVAGGCENDTPPIMPALPSGSETITISGNVFTITINWDDNRDGNVDNNDPSFQMSFQL